MEAERSGDAQLATDAAIMEGIEKSVWPRVDVVLYPSPEETAVALPLSARAKTIIPYAYEEFGDDREPASNHEILFVAGFGHPPNVDAAVWLVSDVMKLIWAQVPNATLSLVGANPTQVVRSLASARSRGHGSRERGRAQGALCAGSDRDGAASNGRGRQVKGGRSAARGIAARDNARRRPRPAGHRRVRRHRRRRARTRGFGGEITPGRRPLAEDIASTTRICARSFFARRVPTLISRRDRRSEGGLRAWTATAKSA